MKSNFQYLLYFLFKIADLIVVNVSFMAAFVMFNHDVTGYINYLLLSNYLWILAESICGAYKSQTIQMDTRSYNGCVKKYLLFMLCFISYVAFSTDHRISAKFVFMFSNFILIGMFGIRITGIFLDLLIRRYLKTGRSVAVLGQNNLGLRLAGYFQNNHNNFSFKGFLNPDDPALVSHDLNDISLQSVRDAAARGIKEIYMPLSIDEMPNAHNLLNEAEKYCVRIKFVPDWDNYFDNFYKINYLGNFPVLSLRKEPLEEVENRVVKRVFDIVFSILVIVFVLSWLYPILGFIIKLQSPGPILYRQLRSGKDNKSFVCYKFRSMKMHDETEFRQASQNDDRITPVGKFIRRTSLDELPQFFNVLIGNMSVIGPRPHTLSMTKEYGALVNQFMVRHFLKAGITGWAQVNGFRGETKRPEMMEERVKCDIWYLENWSMRLDLKIILLTVKQVLLGHENAY